MTNSFPLQTVRERDRRIAFDPPRVDSTTERLSYRKQQLRKQASAQREIAVKET